MTGKGGERTTDDGRRKTEADREPQHVDALLIGETKKGRRQARIGKANGEAKADDGEAREEGREGLRGPATGESHDMADENNYKTVYSIKFRMI